MKRLALIFCLIFLNACSTDVYSITGEISNIKKDSFSINCSNYVAKERNVATADVGHSCIVKITDETLLKSDNGEEITMNDLQQNDVVSVILTEEKTSEEISSQIVEAKEITLIEN